MNSTKWLLIAFIGILMTGGALAHPQGQPRDPLGFLKHAISQAGGPALTTQQETDLLALIESARPTPPGPDDDLKLAHEAFATAVLAGDAATAQAQAAIIAARQAQFGATRLAAEAKFAVSAVGILKSGGQLSALLQASDQNRVVGLVRSLLGPGGFGGPGGPGRGPGGGPGGPGPGGPRRPPSNN